MLVYQLEARGEDIMGCSMMRTVRNTVLFTTHEGAQKRVEKFKDACREKIVDPTVNIVSFEVID